MNLKEVGLVVSSEGLGYAIESYMSYKNIENEELKDLWKQAEETLREIRRILEPYMIEI